jgi:hypothetical protein
MSCGIECHSARNSDNQVVSTEEADFDLQVSLMTLERLLLQSKVLGWDEVNKVAAA